MPSPSSALPGGARAALGAGRRIETGLAALLVVAAAATYGPSPLALGLIWLAAVTPRLIAIDIAEHRLPDAIVLPGVPVALAVVALAAALGQDPGAPLAAALVAGGLFLVLHLAGGMGFGDAKLAPVLGLLLGAAGVTTALAAAFTAVLAGGVSATVALARRGRHSRIPFGPPMLLGTWAAVLLVH